MDDEVTPKRRAKADGRRSPAEALGERGWSPVQGRRLASSMTAGGNENSRDGPDSERHVKTRTVQCKTSLGKCGIPGMDYCLNPYVGCTHACVYCYASFMKRFTGHQEPWGTFLDVRTNVAEVLAKELRRRKAGRVMLSSVTDPYQPAERERQLVRACLKLLANSGMSVSILTKSDLVARDIDVLKQFKSLLGEPRLEVGFTLTTASDELAAWLEPGAAPPSRRLAALEKLSAAGLPTWVFVAPVIPGLTDAPEELEALAAQAHKRGAGRVWFDPMNFYPAAIAGLERAIRKHLPSAQSSFRRAVAEPGKWREKVGKGVSGLESC
jgi:DNA repair photolyase